MAANDLSRKIRECFSKDIMALLKRIGRISNANNYGAFIVGGPVRDLFLGSANLDLDILIEGNAIIIGRALARELGGSLVTHKRFGTCTVITKGGLKIDLAGARVELYERPAALPTVEPSSLEDDLKRRDFTINAMAVSLNKGSFGQLIDFFGGREDLARGRIKVLHDRSFIDDPTRILRAVRFERRLGFRIDSRTEALIVKSAEKNMLGHVGPERIRDEIIMILKEADPVRVFKRMEELHELAFIHPKLRLDKGMARLYESIDTVLGWYRKFAASRTIEKWIICLAALTDRLNYNEISGICGKFALRRAERIKILSYKKYANRIARRLRSPVPLPPSGVYRLLKDLSYEAILLIMARSKSRLARKRIKYFIERSSGVRINVKGGDIKNLGIKPGPRFKKILEDVLYKKIDGVLKTRKDELVFLKKIVIRGDV